MWYVMNWKVFTGYAVLYTVLGIFTGYELAKFKEAYDEARDAGAVA